MLWRNPAAWFGLATLLIPIAIHLLARQRAESRVFPSLRFILPSRLAAVRRRTISDWPLLLVRLALLAVVVAALADPLWLSAARHAEWSARVARAVVIDTSASANAVAGTRLPIVQRETAGAFRSTTIETTDLADGLRRAADWLSTAPPARREIVCVSDFQLGALDPAALRDIPNHVGVRFVRTGTTPATRTADGQPRTHRGTDGVETWTPHVTLNAHETAVGWRSTSGARVTIETTPTGLHVSRFNLRIETNDADRPLLAAAAHAVLAQGVRVPVTADVKPITIVVARDAGPRGDAMAPQPQPERHADADRRAATSPREPNRTALPEAVSLSAPWMSDVLAQIATDPQLAHAVSRAIAADPPGGPSPGPGPSPWIVVMRDAGGHPVLLAASSATRAELVLVWRAAADDEATALLVRAALRAAAGVEPLSEAEVITVADATLAEWQRPASDPPASEWQRVDSHDRRWLWGAALVLLVVEQVMRRGRRSTDAHQDQSYEHAA